MCLIHHPAMGKDTIVVHGTHIVHSEVVASRTGTAMERQKARIVERLHIVPFLKRHVANVELIYA